MTTELEEQVGDNIRDTVEEIYESTKPPEVLVQPLKPKIEIKEENTMEKQARFKVLSAQALATIKAQVIADVVDITEQTLLDAELAIKEIVADEKQQHEILSYIEKRLAKEGIYTRFDKPQIEVKAETNTSAASGTLRDRIKGLVEGK